MVITEIYKSIQGESTFQGMPCVFVRTSGCNLNCTYCDTPFARTNGDVYELDSIIETIRGFHIPYVCITGGEPLLQHDTPELTSLCIKQGWMVSIETNGTIDASSIPEKAARIIDIKCPGSGEAGTFHSSFLHDRRGNDEYKFVITDRLDFEYAFNFSETNKLADTGSILISPVTSTLAPSIVSEWLCNEWPTARLNLQIHTYVWPNERRQR